MVRFVVIQKQRLVGLGFLSGVVGNEGVWDICPHQKMGPRVRDDFSYLGFRVLVPPPFYPVAIRTRINFHRHTFHGQICGDTKAATPGPGIFVGNCRE